MTPFGEIMKRAVEATPDAVGGAFADPDGEMVDSFAKNYVAHDWAILTAHYGVILSHLHASFGLWHFGGPEYFVARHHELDIVVHAIDGGYYALLAIRRMPDDKSTTDDVAQQALRTLAGAAKESVQGDVVKRALLAMVAVVCCLGAVARPAAADSGADYDPHSQSWQGLGAFVGLAEGMGFEVDHRASLEWSEISATDVLVIVYPLQRVDPAKLGAFINAGGNVLVADDFGEARDALASIGVHRNEGGSIRASRYQNDQLWAPIANARGDHPIANDVGDVVTNHPAIFTSAEGADSVVAFEEGSVVVAGTRGSGRFIAVADPSILINRMLQSFPGNIQLATNMLRWLDRDRKARRIVLVRGDFGMFGEPRPYIDDARAGDFGRNIAELNFWLSERRAWLLTPAAMKVLAATLAILLLLLALIALPVRRGPKIDGGWLKFARPIRRDEPHTMISAADNNEGSNLVLACIVRDHVQVLLAGVTNRLEPLYTVPEPQLAADVGRAGGPAAAMALAKVYRRLRALPSRGQAAAPWSASHLPRKDFDLLYKDVAELCRSLGAELPGDRVLVPTIPPAQKAA